MCLGVTVQADVADLCGGDQVDNRVHHAESGAKNGDNCEFFAGKHPNGCLCNRRFDLDLFRRQITGGLIAHELRDFSHQLAEFLNTGVFVPKQGQLMLNQRMLQYM